MEAVAERVEIHDHRHVGARGVGVPAAGGGEGESEPGEDERSLHHERPLEGTEVEVECFGNREEVFEEGFAGAEAVG